MLTSKQRELFQLDKHELVDIITQKDNELNLCYEANITAQKEIDGKIKPKNLTDKQNIDLVASLNKSIGLDGLNNQLQSKMDKIETLLDKVWDGSITDRDFRLDITTVLCVEEGENGVL